MLNVLKRGVRVNKKNQAPKSPQKDRGKPRKDRGKPQKDRGKPQKDRGKPGQEELAGDSSAAIPQDNDTKIALIQALIPIGLWRKPSLTGEAVNELLQEEVNRLAGPAYNRAKDKRSSGLVRWGSPEHSGFGLPE